MLREDPLAYLTLHQDAVSTLVVLMLWIYVKEILQNFQRKQGMFVVGYMRMSVPNVKKPDQQYLSSCCYYC